MRLMNGVVFGAGLGLITAGAGGFANGHALGVYTAGALLVSTEIIRLFSKRGRRN